LLFCFSNQQNHANTASDCYFNANAESASSAYHHGHAVQNNPAMFPNNAASVEPLGGPVMDTETARRYRGGHRVAPVMSRQSNSDKQMVSPDDSSALSSQSASSHLQTPVISDVSNDSSMSGDIGQLMLGAQMPAQCQFSVSLENNASVQVGGQLVHCSSETNLVSAAVSVPRADQSHHPKRVADAGRQVIGQKPAPVSIENAQQLRRRSRSAENLSRRLRQKAGSVAWSAVDVDIKANTESTVTDGAQQLDVQQQVQQSRSGQKMGDGLPSPLMTTRLRPFRQQMNNGVVVSLHQTSNLLLI